LLWLELKRRKLGGHKFTRQLPIGPYVADFACREKWLVVEIDGSQHADNAYDCKRDEFMRSQGYSILRFWSHDVLKHRISVSETILAALDGRLMEDVAATDLRFVFVGAIGRPPLRSAAPTTSPPFNGGEEAPAARLGSLPLPSRTGGEVASRSDNGVGDAPEPLTLNQRVRSASRNFNFQKRNPSP
jgi:very-short-patch-repair endonuclease